MISPRVRFASLIVASLLAGIFHGDADAATDIGSATAIATHVTGAIDGVSSELKAGDRIFEDQEISTDSNGIGQFALVDETRLAVAPDSVIVLDRFIFDASNSASHVVFNVTKGALRFVTGNSPHDAYAIETATATIGVRGTAFDLYVDTNGELAVAMMSGEVEICPLQKKCRRHGVIGKFLHLGLDGAFSLHDRWDGTFLKGIAFASALPFMAGQSMLAPALRGSTRIIGIYSGAGGIIKKATDVVPKATKVLPKVKLPKIRMKKLFP